MGQAIRYSSEEINSVRQILRERRKTLADSLDDAERDAAELSNEAMGEMLYSRTDPSDLGVREGNLEVSQKIIDRIMAEIREINEAESRIQFGTYGICNVCKKNIPISRLLTVPETKVCGSCKMDLERDEKSRRHVAQFLR